MESIYKEKYYEEIISINKEIKNLNKIKKNITLYCYSETKKGKILQIDFKRCISEIERIYLEINNLENQKLIYLRLQENS